MDTLEASHVERGGYQDACVGVRVVLAGSVQFDWILNAGVAQICAGSAISTGAATALWEWKVFVMGQAFAWSSRYSWVFRRTVQHGRLIF